MSAGGAGNGDDKQQTKFAQSMGTIICLTNQTSSQTHLLIFLNLVWKIKLNFIISLAHNYSFKSQDEIDNHKRLC